MTIERQVCFLKIILASKSPRRREILSLLNIPFDVIVSDFDENSDIKDPALLVCELSKRKGMAVARMKELQEKNEEYLVISSDTLVSLDGEIFGKPADREEAKYMIGRLSGKTHSVFSGISLISVSKDGEISEYTDFEETKVTFGQMSDEDIDLYLSLESVTDKAGAYAIQGVASLWIEGIVGNYYNVVGLPVNKLGSLFSRAGVPIEKIMRQKAE